jgi:hypothetical protein
MPRAFFENHVLANYNEWLASPLDRMWLHYARAVLRRAFTQALYGRGSVRLCLECRSLHALGEVWGCSCLANPNLGARGGDGDTAVHGAILDF